MASTMVFGQSPFPVTENDFLNGEWSNTMGWSGLPSQPPYYRTTAIFFEGKDSLWIAGSWGISLWSKVNFEDKYHNWSHFNISNLNNS